MTYIILSVIAYLLGTIPTALVVVRLAAGVDVRSGESGNMGAMNTLRMVSKHRGTGWGIVCFLLVWLIDCGKAFVAVWFANQIMPGSILAQTLATGSVIVGHNYPIWLKGKGGRGAASFMGILMYYQFSLLLVWLLTIFLGSLLTELVVRLKNRQSITGKIVTQSISDQIAGRLLGEIIAVPIVALIEPRLLWPTIVATILIIYRHKERLGKQLQGI